MIKLFFGAFFLFLAYYFMLSVFISEPTHFSTLVKNTFIGATTGAAAFSFVNIDILSNVSLTFLLSIPVIFIVFSFLHNNEKSFL